MNYLKNIYAATASSLIGMALSIKYFFDARKRRPKEYLEDDNYFDKTNGTFTVQYPYEEIPLPDNSRYKLHNEIDDCIVCDKCAKVCPVDCIDIEPIKATETFGHASDGTPLRIYPAKFDIDMSKCCFCGLCTVVCPTECLTMTKEFDFSTDNILDHNFSFSKMTEKEIESKKADLAKAQEEKQAQIKAVKDNSKTASKPVVSGVTKKPTFKPKVMVKPKVKATDDSDDLNNLKTSKPKPVFRPKIQPKRSGSDVSKKEEEDTDNTKPKKPIMNPKIPPKK